MGTTRDDMRTNSFQHMANGRPMGFLYEGVTKDPMPDGLLKKAKMLSIFQGITVQESEHLLKDVEEYLYASEDEEDNDYVAWTGWIKDALDAQPLFNANYILLSQVGTLYASEMCQLYGAEVCAMSTRDLIGKLGTLVYYRQRKDPAEKAEEAAGLKFGCVSRHDLHQRVVDLYYCRSDLDSNEEFMLQLMAAVVTKLPQMYRKLFNKNIMAKYTPVLGIRHQGHRGMAGMPAASMKKIDRDFIYPNNPKALRVFASYLVKQADALGNSRMELTFPVRRRDSIQSGESSVLALEGPNKPDRRKRWCTHCQRSTHTNELCWSLHPERKEAFKKRRRRSQNDLDQSDTPKRAQMEEVTDTRDSAKGGDFPQREAVKSCHPIAVVKPLL